MTYPASLEETVSTPAVLDTQIVTSFASLAELQDEWDEAVSILGGPVYLTYDWLRTWWEHYGNEDGLLRIFIFRTSDEIVGVLPCYIDTLGFGPLKMKVARLVGANIPAKVFDPSLSPAWASDCMETALRHLLSNDHADIVSFGPVSERSHLRETLNSLPARLADVAACDHTVPEVHSVFCLPASMEAYLSSLNKKRKYDSAVLGKEYPIKVEVVPSNSPNLDQEFSDFAEHHALQWQAEGMLGHFAAWPKGLAYNRALIQAQAKRGRVRMIKIWAGEEVVCRQYIFSFGGRWWWELPSRSVGEKWDRLSVGPAGIVVMIGEAIKEGVREIEGGLGHYEYKLRFKADEHRVHLFRAASLRPESAFRQKVFGAFQWLLQTITLKIWYRRVQPHLPPGLRKSQSLTCLRYDY